MHACIVLVFAIIAKSGTIIIKFQSHACMQEKVVCYVLRYMNKNYVAAYPVGHSHLHYYISSLESCSWMSLTIIL